MIQWWQHHAQQFMLFNDTDKQQVEDLTGCIPLLLDAFVRRGGKTLDDLEPEVWEDDILASVVSNTKAFAFKHLHNTPSLT